MAFLRSITNSLRLCDRVIQAILNHGPRVSAVLTEKFGPLVGEGVTLPDFQQLQQFFLDILQAARARVVAAEGEHVDELAGDPERRTLRDEAFGSLKSTILEQRDFFAGAFGPEKAEMLGFPARVGRTPLELLRQGERLTEHLATNLPLSRVGRERVGEGTRVRGFRGRLNGVSGPDSTSDGRTSATIRRPRRNPAPGSPEDRPCESAPPSRPARVRSSIRTARASTAAPEIRPTAGSPA